jgi:hypothetical protein
MSITGGIASMTPCRARAVSKQRVARGTRSAISMRSMFRGQRCGPSVYPAPQRDDLAGVAEPVEPVVA